MSSPTDSAIVSLLITKPGHEPRRALVDVHRRRARPPAADVQPDRHAGLAERLPHRVPLRIAVVALGREQRDVPAGQPDLRGREVDLLRRALGRVDRDGGHAEQPIGRVRRVVRQPAVVAAHAVELQLGVGRLQRPADVEDLDVDAVEVHVLDALDRVPRAGPLILELAHVEREVLRLLPGEVVEGHDRRALALEHAEVAFVGALDTSAHDHGTPDRGTPATPRRAWSRASPTR